MKLEPHRGLVIYNLMFLWPCIMNWPYKTTNVMHWKLFIRQISLLLYVFRVSSTHLQEDKVVHKQHMVPSLSIRVLVSCWCAAIGRTYREWRYHMLLMYDFVLLKMSTWYSKHVEESNNIWWINNFQCITLVVLYGQFMMHGQRNIKYVL